ncbi:hypothetical protein [Paracidovorax konjaci]|uniref:Uncharacterized protein n=1 Tax=Paracidovorax konjaci TaxID=32040 RepID=A0A1I1VVN5_9BURK|nr:hypothetical protein [Paracidovorax konjaci]SFD86809.1 hypothetical protein SAMN04489710_107209 [Paracidovorax konjaci]
MNLRTTHWLGLASALLLFAAGVGLLQARTPEEPTADGAGPALSADARPLSADLVQAFNQEGGLGGFVRQALERPEAGGVFYATQVLRKCRSVLAATPATPPGDPAAGSESPRGAAPAAAETLRQRCAGLSEDDMADDRIARHVATGLQRKDPLLTMAAHAGTSTYQDPQRRKSLLFDMMAAGDPLLVQDVASRIAVQTDPRTGARGYRFDGAFYPESADASVELAFYLLPCGLGLDCTRATDWDLLIRCANGFECAASREDYVATALRGDREAYARVKALSERMLEAIRSGRANSFV